MVMITINDRIDTLESPRFTEIIVENIIAVNQIKSRKKGLLLFLSADYIVTIGCASYYVQCLIH